MIDESEQEKEQRKWYECKKCSKSKKQWKQMDKDNEIDGEWASGQALGCRDEYTAWWDQMSQASHLGNSRWAFPILKITVKVLLVPWEEKPLAWMGQEIVSALLSSNLTTFSHLPLLSAAHTWNACLIFVLFNAAQLCCLRGKFSLQANDKHEYRST